MKRLIVYLAIPFLGAHAGAAPSHPLDGVIRKLVTAGDELKNVPSQPGYMKDMQAQVDQMMEQVSLMTSRAILMPVKTADQGLSRAGYDLVCMNTVCMQYVVEPNARGKQLVEEAQELKAKGFHDLKKAIENASSVSQMVSRMAQDSEYVRNLTVRQKMELTNTFDWTRFSIFKELAEGADQTLDCIQYFTGAIADSGLSPVPSGDTFVWSAASLAQKYGKSRIGDLSTKEKKAVHARLVDMAAKAHETGFTCVAPKKALFFSKEAEALKKDLGL